MLSEPKQEQREEQPYVAIRTEVTLDELPTGPFDELGEATAELLSWADDNGIVWDVRSGENGDEWTSRTEFYLTNPDEEPDSAKWETELAIKVKDG
jgi:hypothetical protein